MEKGKGKFKCDPCGKSYTTKQGLKYHQNQPYCEFNQPAKNNDGNKIHTSEKPRFTCDPCGKSYARNKALLYHQRQPSCKLYKPAKDKDGNIIPNQRFTCEKCEATFESKYSLNRHLKKHLIPNKDARLQNKKRIYTITTLEERAELKCVPCKLKFTARPALYRHKKKNRCNSKKDPSPDLKCPRCKKIFSRKDNLNYHLRRNKCTKGKPKKTIKKLNGPKKLFKCPSRERYLSSKSAFSHHKKWTCPMNQMDADGNIIPRVPRFLCEKCGSNFSNQNNLARHKDDRRCERKLKELKGEQMLEDKLNGPEKKKSSGVIEGTLKPMPWYKCDKCKKYFSSPSSLIRHQKNSCPQYLAQKASGELFCKYCHLVFATTDQLKFHQVLKCLKAKIHETNKILRPFNCKLCNLRCAKKETLDYHQYHKICENNKKRVAKYQCKKCHQRLALKQSLAIHHRRRTCQRFALKEAVSQSLKEKSDKDDLKVQFFCWWCSSQAEMVQHMETVHDKEIAKEKLKIADEETLKIDPAKPRIHCCYICLRKYPSVTPTVLCIRSCERDIGVSMEDFVPLRDRKLGGMFGKHV